MKKIDKELKNIANCENLEMPESVKQKIEFTLSSLPEGKTLRFSQNWGKKLCTAAAVLIIVFIALPNMSAGICSAMSEIPVIGRLVKVVTFREYKLEGDNYSADVKMPAIDTEGESEKFTVTAEGINGEVVQMTEELLSIVETQREETQEEVHAAIYEDYRVIVDSDDWFTLEVTFWMGVGSSNTIYKYYHIDKSTDELVVLSDLFDGDEYITAISEEVKRQMRQQMAADDGIIYWVDDPIFEFEKINKDMNFYFSDSGNIILVFDKYDIAPGYMGCPSFEIPKSVYSEYLK